ncbi:MAG: hypothetical protein A2Z21_01040 [Candidatus Fraserbacteria bacterium RBG_16_55_9]|uniref:Uncharacterized protein n=1 Tax=Fraserbacteria sp. (strain RBG_16_55_9) TaxID=1817864 RepID=A0A1F5US96_FRAXR|nr:MAG: hypothetical protein A2Z21_01040 [Candidatus Fraserbacteria bacterium RBG_16_55_9]
MIAYLRGKLFEGAKAEDYPQTFVERLNWKAPSPLIRHHFGRPTLKETEEGIRKIAEAMAIDVISLGIDQDAQEISSILKGKTSGARELAVFPSVRRKIIEDFMKPAAVATFR